MLIAVEGIDYSGKSTLTKHIVEYLEMLGKRVGRWSNFYDQPNSKTWLELMMADNPGNDVESEILIAGYAHRRGRAGLIKLLEENDIVVMDRYTLSYHVMQGFYPKATQNNDVAYTTIQQVIKMIDMPVTALEFILDIDEATFTARRDQREGQLDTIDLKPWDSYHAILREGFQKEKVSPLTHQVRLDGTRPDIALHAFQHINSQLGY